MESQLILQFRGDSLESYDAMIALEGELMEALENPAEVDRHFAPVAHEDAQPES